MRNLLVLFLLLPFICLGQNAVLKNRYTTNADNAIVHGDNLDLLRANNLATGIADTARLGTGTANANTALFGDNTWKIISGTGNLIAEGTNGITVVTNGQLTTISFNGLNIVISNATFQGPFTGSGAAAGKVTLNSGTGTGGIFDYSGATHSNEVVVVDANGRFVAGGSVTGTLVWTNTGRLTQTVLDPTNHVGITTNSFLFGGAGFWANNDPYGYGQGLYFFSQSGVGNDDPFATALIEVESSDSSFTSDCFAYFTTTTNSSSLRVHYDDGGSPKDVFGVDFGSAAAPDINVFVAHNNATVWSVSTNGIETASGFIDSSGTPGSIVAYQGGNRLSATNIQQIITNVTFTTISVSNLNVYNSLTVNSNAIFNGKTTVNNITITNGLTNLNLTANTALKADGGKQISSIANASGVLTNDGSGNLGFSASASGAGSITVSSTANQTTVSGSPVSLGGTVTIGTVQNIGTVSSPQFSGLTATNSINIGGVSQFTNRVDFQAGISNLAAAYGTSQTNTGTIQATNLVILGNIDVVAGGGRIQSLAQTNTGNIQSATLNTTSTATIGSTLNANGNIVIAAGNIVNFGSRANIGSPAAGVLTLKDNAGSGFASVIMGPVSNTWPTLLITTNANGPLISTTAGIGGSGSNSWTGSNYFSQALLSAANGAWTGSNYFQGAVTTSTNQNQITPDFSVEEQLISTNAAFTLLSPVGVDTTKKLAQWTLIHVTNTTASAVLITSPANCHTVGTAYVTNLTDIWLNCYGGAFTNAFYVPIF